MQAMVTVVQGMLDDQAERYSKVVEGMPEEALNWRPGNEETNSVAQLVRHVTAVQSVLLGRAIDDVPPYDHAQSLRNDPATKDELLGLIAAAKARKSAQLARADELDLSEEVETPRGPVLRARYVIHSADHGQEHLGHAELTKQLWEQRG
jgi:hypothetical protein